MMSRVVEEGTGTAGALAGITVAGKTGTAEVGANREFTQPWFIAFAPVDDPQMAIAVTVERQPAGQGGTVAAPIAKPVLEAMLGGGHDRGRQPARSSTAATGSCAASARAAWPTCTAPRTRTSGREVALKVLHRRFAQDQEFVERFRREAKAAAGLQHPNVVGVFDRGEHEGTYYIAMELPRRAARSRTSSQSGGAAAAGARDRPRHRRSCGGRLRAPPRRDPPRLQAAQRDRRRAGPRQGHGLRHRPRRRVGDDGDRLDHGHGALPVARAGAGPRRHRRLRPLLDRRDALRDARRAAAVRGRQRRGDRAQAPLRAARADLAAAARRQPGARGRRDGRAREGPGAALAEAEDFVAGLEAARAQIEAGANGGQDDRRVRAVPLPAAGRPGRGALAAVPPAPRRSATGAGRWFTIGLLALALRRLPDLAVRERRADDGEERRPARDRHSSSSRRARCSSGRASRSSETRVRSAQPVDQVLDQDPNAGEEAEEGSTVTLEVSDGPGDVPVPAVEGLPQRAGDPASSRTPGLKVTRRPASSRTTVRKGFAIRTVPREGEERRARHARAAVRQLRARADHRAGRGRAVARLGGVAARATRASAWRSRSRSRRSPRARSSPRTRPAASQSSAGTTVTITVSTGTPAGERAERGRAVAGPTPRAQLGNAGLVPVAARADRHRPGRGRRGDRPAARRRHRGRRGLAR